MDFERATLTAFFYDYPMGMAVDLLTKKTANIDAILEPLPQLMRERFPAFNVGEYRLWRNHLKGIWKDKINENDGILLPFELLPEFCKTFINTQSMNVEDGQLLRWRELAVSISEDLIICSVLAKNDAVRRTGYDFAWKDALQYEGTQNLFNHGLYDLHAHLDASSDAFNIAWIDRMNRFNHKRGAEINVHNERMFDEIKILKPSQEKMVEHMGKPYSHRSFMNWVSLAAVLRYRIFEVVAKDKHFTTSDIADIREAISDTSFAKSLLFELFADCDTSRASSPRVFETFIGRWDYVLGVDSLNGIDLSSPQCLLMGERWLIYTFLFQLYKNPTDRSLINTLPVFYLYLLIKLRARREIIQTNRMSGLANYQQYQENYKAFVSKDTTRLHWVYAIQTSVADATNHVECRTSTSRIEEALFQRYDKSLLYKDVATNLPLKGTHTFVVSISKSTKDVTTREYIEYRNTIKTELDKVLSLNAGRETKVHGIDFTGSDRKMRPEVYGQFVRYARTQGLVNFTYHAGEDFFDLLDGIRTIDEVIYHLRWNNKCRLGHCLSLFTDADTYYRNRHFKCFLPRQILLDNLVWFKIWSEALHIPLSDVIQQEIERLYNDIGYGTVYVHKAYVSSMKLRGDNMNRTMDRAGSSYSESALRSGQFIEKVRNSRAASKLLHDYLADKDIYKNGNVFVEWKHPETIISGIKAIQDAVLNLIKKKGVSIELCPTSNIQIGNFDRYDQLPIRDFVLRDIPFNINTDDKGILATNIENEYSLVYASLKKAGINDASIIRYMDTIITNSRKMKF